MKSSGGGVIGLLVLLAIIFWIIVTIIHQRKTINEYKEKQKDIDSIDIERKKAERILAEAQNNSSKTISDAQKKAESILAGAELDRIEIESRIQEIKNAFSTSFIQGRQWLANMIAEANASVDSAKAEVLRTKRNPAIRGADIVTQVRNEKKELTKKLKLLEYQVQTYKEYFPFLEEYENEILDEALSFDDFSEKDFDDIDKVYKYLSPEEYKKLSTTQRNQLALDRYIQRHKSNYEIGRLYEMFIGHLYEKDGWRVQYFGMLKQKEDMGRDLICEKKNQTLIIQTKNWSKSKLIHEKHIFQLFGTTFEYRKQNPRRKVTPIFITSTDISDVARNAADMLKIEVKENIGLETNFPMIKCNISSKNGEKIYHLPFDQMYNRTIIEKHKGEFYASTVAEAEAKGFRRAMKHAPYSG